MGVTTIRCWTVGFAAVSLILAGCSSAPGPSASAPVSIAKGGQASLAGVTLSIPPHGVDSSSTLTMSQGSPRSGWDANDAQMQVVGNPIQAELSDGVVLRKPASVRFPIPTDLPPANRLMVLWEDGEGGYRPLPIKDQTKRSITAVTNHFSVGWLAAIDVPNSAKQWTANLGNYLSARSDVAQPTCGDEQSPRDAGVEVASNSGDTVKWCFGNDSGRQVLRIANNRRTFTTITYPSAWKVLDGNSHKITLDSAARLLGSKTTFPPTGRAVRTIDGGDTLTLAVPEGSSGRAEATSDFVAWAFTALVYGVEVYTSVAKGVSSKVGKAAQSSSDRILAALMGDGGSYTEAFAACAKAFGEHADFRGPSDVFSVMWDCIPQLMRADIESTGLSMFGLGQVLSSIGGAVAAVLTGVHLLTTSGREIWDNIASLNGNSDADYLITVRAPAAAIPSTPEPTAPPPEAAEPVNGWNIGDQIAAKCSVAWPTAPTTTATAILMRMTCIGQPRDHLFVDVQYGDPNLPITPNTGSVHVYGTVVDEASNGNGYQTLQVIADRVTIP